MAQPSVNCPRCRTPVTPLTAQCPECNNPLRWGILGIAPAWYRPLLIGLITLALASIGIGAINSEANNRPGASGISGNTALASTQNAIHATQTALPNLAQGGQPPVIQTVIVTAQGNTAQLPIIQTVVVTAQGNSVQPPIVQTVVVTVESVMIITNTVEILVTAIPLADTISATIQALTTLKFNPAEFFLRTGDTISLYMTSDGALEHNFVWADNSEIDFLHTSIGEQGAGPRSRIFSLPGVYEFYCNIPGHREAGMVGQVVVR